MSTAPACLPDSVRAPRFTEFATTAAALATARVPLPSVAPGESLVPGAPGRNQPQRVEHGGGLMGGTNAILAPTRADAQFAWHDRRRRWRMILNELDRRLQEEHLIGDTEFDVLITLDNADGHPRRMTDIAEAVTMSPSGVTRLVERLESRGLVQRIRDPSDARVVHASLTAAGSERLARASATHDAVIDYLFGTNPEQLAAATRRATRKWPSGMAEAVVTGFRAEPRPLMPRCGCGRRACGGSLRRGG